MHMEEDKNIKKWLSGELNKQELREFESSEDFQSLNRLDRALQAFKSPEYSIEEELKRSNQRKAADLPATSWVKPWMKVAASLLLVATMLYIFLPKTESELTQVLAKVSSTSIILPDSSTVMLNKGSMLSYDEDRWATERKVMLNGEGFFEVRKGSSFEVITGEGNVKVLGTAFNVTAWKNFFAVDCFHGKVAVTKGKTEAVLLANQRLQYIGSTGGEIETFESEEPTWMVGESSFEGVPFHHVLKALERQYDVKVVAKSIDTRQSFSGSFTHTDLDLAIRSITVPLNLQYETNDSEIILMSGSPN